MGSFARVLAVSLCLITSWSCRQHQSGLCPSPQTMLNEAPSVEGSNAVSTKLSAQILVDASLSMQGFVNTATSSRYSTFIQDLQRSFVVAWPNASVSRVQFYQFGAVVKPVPESKGYLAATERSFYTDPEVYRETHIDAAFRTLNPNSLSIVVTDLFQTKGDESAMVETLSQKLVNSDLAFAVIAMRSEFKGRIYDVGPRGLNFLYSSTNGRPNTYRPFYALILGRLPDVLHYLSEMERLHDPSDDQFNVLVLTAHVMAKPLTFSNGRITALKGAIETFRFLGFTSEDVQAFEMRAARPLQLTSTIKFEEVQFGPPISLEDSNFETRAVYWHDKPTDSATANEAIVASIKGSDPQTAALTVEIDPRKLAPPGVYAFELRLSLPPESAKLPLWCHAWDMSDSKLSDGTKTYNLQPFLSDLWTAVLIAKKPEIGRFYLYVQTN